MWAHSLRIRGPRPSIPIALVGSKETSDSNTSEVEIEMSEMSERVEDNVGRKSRGGNSKELSVKMEKKYLLKSEALSKSEVAKAEHSSWRNGAVARDTTNVFENVIAVRVSELKNEISFIS